MLTLLFGISPLDPVTYAGVIGLLLAVAAFGLPDTGTPGRRHRSGNHLAG